MRVLKTIILASFLLLPASAQKIRLGNQTQGTLPVNQGGTGATSATQAVTNIGAAPLVHTHAASDIVSGKHGSTTLLQTFVGGTEPVAGNAACWDINHNLTDCGAAPGGGGGGAVSNAANVGTQGFGVFKNLSGGILNFLNLNPLSTRLSVTNNSSLNTIDMDVNESALNMNNTSTVLSVAKGGTGFSTKTNAFDALSPNNTKGDIAVHNGTNNVRLGVGSDGQVLTADSTQPAGIKWAAVSGGGGAGAVNAGDLKDFQVVRSTTTRLTIGANCSSADPCLVRMGSNVYRFTSAATADISGGTGTAYVYIAQDGTLTVGHSMTIACTNCTTVSGITAFPVTSIPVATWTATTTGQWDTSGGTDQRGFFAKSNYFAGSGLLGTTTGGNTTLSIDQTTVSTFASGSAVPGSCTAYGQFFFNTSGASGAKLNYCNGSTFESVSGGGGGSSVPTVYSTPGVGFFVPWAATPDPTASQTYSSAALQPKVFQFVMPFQAQVGHVTFNVKAACTSCGMIVEIHNTAGANGVGSLVATTTTFTTAVHSTGIETIALSAPVTLAPGAYWLTILSEDTALTLTPVASGNGILSYLNNNSSWQRAGFCGNAGSGSGGTLAMPSSCGTLNGSSSVPQPFMILEP